MKKIFLLFVFYYSIFITPNSLLNAQWIQYPLPYNGIAYSLGFYNANTGVTCGHTINSFSERIFYTTNSGTTWNLANYPTELRSLPCVQFINASTIYAGGAENLFVNENFNYHNDFLNYPKSLRQKFIMEGKREFIVEYKAAFVKSTDAGLNWQKVGQFDTLKGYINDIFFFNTNTGYALIDVNPFHNTGFYKTTNAGTNWQFIKIIEVNSLVDKMIFFDMNTGIAKGFNYGGRIYKTTNGGVNWLNTNMQSQIDGITFFNSTTGLAIGVNEGGISTNIYKTTNTGNNWNLMNVIYGNWYFTNLKSILNTGTAFAVGVVVDSNLGFGKITTMKATNYGINWVIKEFNPVSLAYGLALVDQNNFFIGSGDVSSSALILKSTNGGNVFVNQIGNEIPSSFSLLQNYPNPFNPATSIKYQVASIKFIKLVVYDILGNEMATLVNEKQSPGMYEVSWDASAYPSGVYFYTLEAESYKESKKLVLIK